jgi:hypothetical protein
MPDPRPADSFEPTTDDRRAEPRHDLATRAACWLSGPALPDGAAAVVMEASSRGAGLYLRHRPEPRRAKLQLVGGPSALRGPIPLRVVHCRETEDGGFEAGVEFDVPLSEEELAALTRG